jgi:hypothetical protein
VHLDGQIKALALHLVEEVRHRVQVAFRLRHAGKTGKLGEAVKVTAQARRELAHPRQADERDVRAGIGRIERAQRRDGAKQAAEAERPEERNPHRRKAASRIPALGIRLAYKRSAAPLILSRR